MRQESDRWTLMSEDGIAAVGEAVSQTVNTVVRARAVPAEPERV